MNIETLSVRSIITNRDGVHNFFAWPSVARLKNGYLAATASGFRINHLCPFGKVVMSVSPDEGKTWSIPAIVFDTPLDDRDSGIVPFGESSVMVTSFNNGLRAHDAMNGCTQEREAGLRSPNRSKPSVPAVLRITLLLRVLIFRRDLSG